MTRWAKSHQCGNDSIPTTSLSRAAGFLLCFGQRGETREICFDDLSLHAFGRGRIPLRHGRVERKPLRIAPRVPLCCRCGRLVRNLVGRPTLRSMVDLVGRVPSTDRGISASTSSAGHQSPSANLRDNGALACLGRSYDYRGRDGIFHAATVANRQKYLTHLLSPLVDNPENLASRLLKQFGSLASIGAATETELRQCALYGESWLDSFLSIRQLVWDGYREEAVRTQINVNDKRFHRYLITLSRGRRHETMWGFFTDAAGFLISEEELGQGDEKELKISARRIFARALAIDARRIVLAHNHTSGSTKPSLADIEHTIKLDEHARVLGISIDDHLIIGLRQVTSMRQGGYFERRL